MKWTILYITVGIIGLANAATVLSVAGDGGAIDGTATTYSISVGSGTFTDETDDGISFTSVSTANPVVITFTSAVDLVISSNSLSSSFIFDVPGSFTSVGGVLNFSAGTQDPTDTADGSYATMSGNGTNTISWTAVEALPATTKTESNHDWGMITANGITSISFSNSGSFKDTFVFTASVPEPTSTSLISLSTLALLARRQRRSA